MAIVSYSYGFVASSDADVSSSSEILSISTRTLALLPLSAYRSAGGTLPGGMEAPSTVSLACEDGTTAPTPSGAFVRYESSGYDFAGASQSFDEAFSEAASKYRCAVEVDGRIDDIWLLFNSAVDADLVMVGTSFLSAWWVDRSDPVSVKRLAVAFGVSARMGLRIPGKTAYRWLAAAYPTDGAGSSFCIASDTATWQEATLMALGEEDGDDGRLISLGGIQLGTRGATVYGGTVKKAGFLVQLDQSGLLDESVLPESLSGFMEALAAEKEERIAADDALGDSLAAKADEADLAGYLPRSGGTMNGAVQFTGGSSAGDAAVFMPYTTVVVSGSGTVGFNAAGLSIQSANSPFAKFTLLFPIEAPGETDVVKTLATTDQIPAQTSEEDPVFTEWRDGIIVRLGSGAAASGTQSIAIGYNSAASGAKSTAVGEEAEATQADAIALGRNAKCYGIDCLVVGASAKAQSTRNSLALGTLATATGSSGETAIGYNSKVEAAANAMQLGEGTNTTAGTLQFRSYQILDASGNIPAARLGNLASALSSLSTEIAAVKGGTATEAQTMSVVSALLTAIGA